MNVIKKYIKSKRGYIIEDQKDQLIFILCARYYYIVKKINNKYIITKNKKDKKNYIVVSPEVCRRTQGEIVNFLKSVRN